MFSSKSFMILALIFRLLIYFELIRSPASFFCMWKSSWPSCISWRNHPFPTEWNWHPCQESTCHRCMGLFLDSYFWFYSVDLYVLMPVPHWVFFVFLKHHTILIATVLCKVLKSFFLKKWFRLFSKEPLAIPYEFEDWLSYFCKRGHSNFDRDCIKTVDQRTIKTQQ